MSTSKTGICYLVGAGPGDIGLITVRGRECIEEADVLIYDYLSNSKMLTWAKPEAEKIYAGKKAKEHTLNQEEINQLLIDHCQQGKTVTRLKGGDPILFGRGGEEAQALARAGVPFTIVPGISSAIAGPIYAGIPVTHRDCNSQLTIFTGHEDPTKQETQIDYAKLAQAEGTKVLLMGVERMDTITATLIKEGADPKTPIALVRWATLGKQETLVGNLGNIAQRVAEKKFQAPAVAVIGKNVELREQINWFESRPLFGKRIVVTRTRKQASALSRELERLGAEILEIPTIRIEPPQDLRAFGELVKDAHIYDWLLFTSPNGVEAFFDMFYQIYHDAREIGGVRIAAIGSGTAQKIKAFHLQVDLLPEESVAESLVEALCQQTSVENLKFLWVRGESARPVLAEELSKRSAIVDEAIAYRTIPEMEDHTGALHRFKEEGADIITFTSSSTVEHFLNLDLPLPKHLQIASIGPITSATLKKRGLCVDIEAKEHSISGLVEAIKNSVSTGN